MAREQEPLVVDQQLIILNRNTAWLRRHQLHIDSEFVTFCIGGARSLRGAQPDETVSQSAHA